MKVAIEQKLIQKNKVLAELMEEHILIAIRYSPWLRAFYDRIKVKKGKGKVIIATAKKHLNIIYFTRKENVIFEDFSNGVIRTI